MQVTKYNSFFSRTITKRSMRLALSFGLLSVLLLGQQPGTLAGEAMQLPASGPKGPNPVNTQQSTVSGQSASVIQPSLQVNGAY
ncbi:MAG: hypothetical protein ACRD6B_22925, partial [Bryobacteraceae bacterium]